MYTPAHFAECEPEVLNRLVAERPLATLVVITPEGLEATHVPLMASEDGTRLVGHVARMNPIAAMDGYRALAIFQGPEQYISPNWYASKTHDSRVVPTWNYTAVHIHGVLRTFADPERLLGVVSALTEKMEAGGPEPWKVSDAPAVYIDKLLNAITGIEIAVDRREGKWKVSQNRPPMDRESVAAALDGTAMAELIRKASR